MSARYLFDVYQRYMVDNDINTSNKKIGVYKEYNIYYLTNADKELITRFSQEINQAIWYQKTNQHILCMVGGTVKIIELDGRDERNTVDVLRLDIDQIAYNPENKGIYFIRENKLSSISLE